MKSDNLFTSLFKHSKFFEPFTAQFGFQLLFLQVVQSFQICQWTLPERCSISENYSTSAFSCSPLLSSNGTAIKEQLDYSTSLQPSFHQRASTKSKGFNWQAFENVTSIQHMLEGTKVNFTVSAQGLGKRGPTQFLTCHNYWKSGTATKRKKRHSSTLNMPEAKSQMEGQLSIFEQIYSLSNILDLCKNKCQHALFPKQEEYKSYWNLHKSQKKKCPGINNLNTGIHSCTTPIGIKVTAVP